MSDYKCPECGAPMNVGERRCANCDYELTDAEYTAMMVENMPAQAPDTPTSATGDAPASKQPAAAPESVMAHGNVDVSQHHSEDKSTHNIDNSQTVNNTNQTVTNTFIIMGGGAPLPPNVDPQTAAALEQAQRAQQQVQPTPHVAEPQPVQKPVQETVTPPTDAQKGVGAINGSRRPVKVDVPRKGLPKWVWSLVLIAVVGVVLFVLFRPAPKTETVAPAKVERKADTPAKKGTATKPSETVAPTPKQEHTTTTPPKAETTPKPAPKKEVTPKVKTLAEMTPAEAYTAGMKYYNSGDYANAVTYLTKAANANNGDAAYQLGEMYYNGTGVAADKNTAIHWYEIAAKAGNKQAKRKLF